MHTGIREGFYLHLWVSVYVVYVGNISDISLNLSWHAVFFHMARQVTSAGVQICISEDNIYKLPLIAWS